MLREVGFAGFVRENTPALLRTAYLLTGNAQQAEELVQDTLVRLYPKWDRVAGADVPLAYVRRSLTNNFLNGRRRRSAGDLLFAEPPEQSYDPELGNQLSDRQLVRRLLNSLPPRQRAVLVLRFFDDLEDTEIASIIGCRRGTVRSIISRSLQQLRAETEQPAASRPRQTNGNLR